MIIMKLILTTQQKDRLQILSKRWAVVSQPTPEIGWYNEKDGGSVGVVVGTESNPEHMYIGLEPDGYAHT
tara:strand:+ start:1104 stop:1313 length:210 start_codon:yes stop_codon:yes gene_type:complete